MHGNEIMNKLIIHSDLVSSFRSTRGIHWEGTGGGGGILSFHAREVALAPGADGRVGSRRVPA